MASSLENNPQDYPNETMAAAAGGGGIPGGLRFGAGRAVLPPLPLVAMQVSDEVHGGRSILRGGCTAVWDGAGV